MKKERRVGRGSSRAGLYSAHIKRRGASRGRADATKPRGEGRDTEIINKLNLI